MKNILDYSRWRTAIKTFDKSKEISDVDFNLLLEVARYSPSSFGLEPWKIIVVRDKDLRKKISNFSSGAKTQLQTASHFVIFTVTTDLKNDSEYFKYMMMDIKGFNKEKYQDYIVRINEFQEKNHNINDNRKRIDWAGKQAYIALGNMLLAAATIGIDSCPIEGFIPEKINKILQENGIIKRDKEKTVVMAAFGYRDSMKQHSKIRRPLKDIVKYV